MIDLPLRIVLVCRPISGIRLSVGMISESSNITTTITIPHCKHPQRCFGGSFMRSFHQNHAAEAISILRRSAELFLLNIPVGQLGNLFGGEYAIPELGIQAAVFLQFYHLR